MFRGNDAALEAHRAAPHFLKWREEVKDWFASDITRHLATPVYPKDGDWVKRPSACNSMCFKIPRTPTGSSYTRFTGTTRPWKPTVPRLISSSGGKRSRTGLPRISPGTWPRRSIPRTATGLSGQGFRKTGFPTESGLPRDRGTASRAPTYSSPLTKGGPQGGRVVPRERPPLFPLLPKEGTTRFLSVSSRSLALTL